MTCHEAEAVVAPLRAVHPSARWSGAALLIHAETGDVGDLHGVTSGGRLFCREAEEQMRPKIEILVVRDPEIGSDVRVFVDGSERGVFVYDVDAGTGHEDVDWAESYEEAKSRRDISEAFRTELLHALANPPGREYIDGWNWGESIEDVIARLRKKRMLG